MAYSLAQAAEAVGMARSSILRAIKAGKISATRDENNEWQIEPAELHRVHPAPAAKTSRTDELIAELRARLEDMRSALATATANAETWRAAFEREQAHRVAGGRRGCPTVFNLDHRVPRDVVAYGAPGGMDAARGAVDLKEISREIQARLQAIHPTPS